MSGPRQQRGFTLIELVVVLAILAAAAVLVLPAVGRGTETLRLRGEAGRVAALLREARLHAVSRRQPTRVTLDPARHTVALGLGPSEPSSRQIAMSPGVRLHVETGGETLTFSPRGVTREARWIVEGAGGRRLAIEVQGVSGQVTVVAEATQ